MLHRRILHDHGLGVGEALNETAYGIGLVVTGKHILLVERPLDSARLHRTGAQQFYMQPLATYAMPMNVHLLTFDQLSAKQYLVRVEHYFELNEDPIYSQSVTFELQTLFEIIGTINETIELVLTANLPLSGSHRLN